MFLAQQQEHSERTNQLGSSRSHLEVLVHPEPVIVAMKIR